MSFERPSLNSLDTTIRADMQANIDAIQIVGPRTALAGISRAQAGGIHGLHGHAAHNFKQLFPDTSDIAQLERQAGFYGIARRQAFRALGEVVVTGDDATVIPAGTRFGAPSGVEIATTEAGVIAAGSVTLTVQAIEAGAGGNLAQDTGVSFTSPVAGALNTAQIAVPGMALGTDIESRESLSDRVLERMRDVPHGGAAFDYVEQLRALFPRGKAWPEARGPVWDSLLRSLAGELQRFDGRLCDLLEESDPRTTVEALEDWERVLGLPDACFGSGGTVDERPDRCRAPLDAGRAERRVFRLAGGSLRMGNRR